MCVFNDGQKNRIALLALLMSGLLLTLPCWAGEASEQEFSGVVQQYRSQHYADALRAVEALEATYLEDARLPYYKALCYQRLGNSTLANEAFQQVIWFFPTHPVAVLAQKALGQPTKASDGPTVAADAGFTTMSTAESSASVADSLAHDYPDPLPDLRATLPAASSSPPATPTVAAPALPSVLKPLALGQPTASAPATAPPHPAATAEAPAPWQQMMQSLMMMQMMNSGGNNNSGGGGNPMAMMLPMLMMQQGGSAGSSNAGGFGGMDPKAFSEMMSQSMTQSMFNSMDLMGDSKKD